MATISLDEYVHMWTTQRHHYALITLRYCAKNQLFIYYKPTKKVMLTHDPELDRLVIQHMLDSGVEVIDDNLFDKQDLPC